MLTDDRSDWVKITKDNFQTAKSYALLGFDDYIAARVLLEKEYLIQAAILASTAVEKFLKFNEIARGSRLRGHLNTLSDDKILKLSERYSINGDFIKLLKKFTPFGILIT